MQYTLGQASKATGIPKPRLSRAIKNGTISATKTHHGGYEIDAAELHRVFPIAPAIPRTEPGTTPARVTELQTRLEAAERRIADKDDVIEDLRHRLNEATRERQEVMQAAAEERHRLTLLLTHQAEQGPQQRRGFFARLFG